MCGKSIAFVPLSIRGINLYQTVKPHEIMVRLPAVLEITGLAKSTLYKKMADGQFPRSVKIGPRACAWIWSEINGWVADQIAASRLNRPASTITHETQYDPPCGMGLIKK
jgi:prophage regulatory protein